MICSVCGRDTELRFGVCWDCATAKSIIEDGTDMYDKTIEHTNTAMGKLKFLVLKGWKIQNYERLSDSVVLIDGKHYRLMKDNKVARFIWGKRKKVER